MKLNRLALAVLVATGVLTSCSDDDKKPETKTVQSTTEKAAPKMTAAELQSEVEKRYKHLAQVYNDWFAKINSLKRSGWQDFQVVISDYQGQADSATAKTTTTVMPSPSFPFAHKPIVLESNDQLTYNQALLDQGIIANVDMVPANVAAILDTLTLSKNGKAFMEGLLNHLKSNVQLLPNENVKSTTEITPFSIKLSDDNDIPGTAEFKGFKLVKDFNEKDFVENPNASNNAFEVGAITVKPDKEDGFFTFAGTKGTLNLTVAGDVKQHVEPMKFEFKDDDLNLNLEIQQFDATGTGNIYDPVLGGYLGKISGKIGDFLFAENGEPATNYGNITFGGNTAKNGSGNYDLSGELNFNLNGEELQKRLELPIQPTQLSSNGGLNNLSPEAIESFYQLAQLSQIEDEDARGKAALEAGRALLNNLILNKTQWMSHLKLTTSAGGAKLDGKLSLREGLTDENKLQAIVDGIEENPMVLLDLLKDGLDFSLQLSVDQSLLKAFGVAEMLEMQAGPFVELKDGQYHLNLETTPEGIKLNGNPLPL